MSTTCCNGYPSSVFQDSRLLINPPSPDPRQPPFNLRNEYRLPSSSESSSFGYPPVHRVPIYDSTAASNPRSGSGSGRTCRRNWILANGVVWLVAVAASVTISCLLMRTVLSQEPELESGSGDRKRMNTCVPCSPGKGQAMETGIESKTNVFCCVSDGDKMQQLIIEGVRLSLQDRLKGEELYALLNNPMFPPPINKDAAHVFFRRPIRQRHTKPDAYLDQSQSDNFETLRDWSSVGESAFVRPGIELNSTRGHFRVKNAGIYVIYSRIVYEGTDDDDDDDDDDDSDVTSDDVTGRLVFGHSVSLYQRSGYKTLLEDEQAVVCHRRTVCYNSQIFSTLHLGKDSRIAVRATLARLVSPRAHASYFGLYKID